MGDAVPVHVAEIFIKHLDPKTIIDGETAYDVRMWDSLIFYGCLLFLLLFPCVYRLIPDRVQKENTAE